MSLRRWIDDIEKRDWQTTENGTVRFALIGLGWWTVDVAIPAIEESDLCETTVLVSSSADKASSLAEEHGVSTGMDYDAFHAGEAADAYDAIYIGTPNAYHQAYAETAASLGKAVLCEKPIEATAERAETMVRTCREAEVPFMAAYRMQTDPLVRRAKELIEEGLIGEPRYVYGTNAQRLLEMIPDPDQWRLDPDLTGYGTSVMDLGIYVLNTARFLLEREPTEAFARMQTHDAPFADVPDQWASYSLHLEDDIHLVGSTSQDAQRETVLSVVGDQGRLKLEPAYTGEARLHVSAGDVRLEVSHGAVDVEREMTEEFDYFADRVITGHPIGPDGRHALWDMETIAAIHRAADLGEPVAVDEPSA